MSDISQPAPKGDRRERCICARLALRHDCHGAVALRRKLDEASGAANRELAAVLRRLKTWSQDPPPALVGLAPANAFAFAANALEVGDHHTHESAPPDEQAVERRVDLLDTLQRHWPIGMPAVDLAGELYEPDEGEALAEVLGDLGALERAHLVRVTTSGFVLVDDFEEQLVSAGLHVLASRSG